MKRRLATYIAIVSLLLVVASASYAEFVRNGGFEVGGNIVDFKALGRPAAFQNYELPAEWLLNSPHGGGGYRHSGGHNGQRYWYTGGWYMLRQNIGGLELGKTYMISYYGKGSSNRGHQPRVRFYWNGAVQFNLDGSDTSGRWTHYSRTFTVTEEEVTGGMIWLNSVLSGGYAGHFDDISLVIAPVMNSDEGWNVRLAAARALASMKGPRAVAGLIAALKDNEERLEVRREAARGLGLMGADAVVPLISLLGEDISTDFARLRAQLTDRNFKKRKAAAEGLLRLGHAIIPLAKKAIAKTDDPEVRLTLRGIVQKISRTKGGVFLLRAAAAKALGEIGDARAMEPLIGSLKDNRFEVRREAAEALGKIKNTGAIEALIASLKDNQSSVRVSAAQALAGFQDPRCVEPLLNAMTDRSWGVRYWAVRGVAYLKDESCFEPLTDALVYGSTGVRQTAAEGLALFGAQAVEPMILALREKDPIVVEVITKAFVRIGTPAMDALLEALADDNWQVRLATAKVLGRMGDTRAVKPLVGIVEIKDDNVRPVAVEALGQIGDSNAAGAVIEVLSDQLQNVSTGAFVGMDEGVVAPLTEAVIKHESRRVRRGAAEALGVIGDPRAVDALVGALKDAHLQVRKSAVLALALLEDARAHEGLIEILKDEDLRLRAPEDGDEEQPGEAGPASLEDLVAILKDKDKEARHRQKAAVALGKTNDRRAVEPLIDALKDDSAEVRWRAAEGLGKLNDRRAVEPLIEAMKDKKSFVRWRIAEALGEIRDKRAIVHLIKALRDSDRYVRIDAAKALIRITGQNFGQDQEKWKEWRAMTRK